MKDRIKWMLVGLGFTFGLQVLISLIFTGVAFSAARSQSGVPESQFVVVVFGLTLGAFLIGAFVIGWMSDELRIVDALCVAILTLLLTGLVHTALRTESNQALFVTGNWLGSGTWGQSAIYVLLALAGAAAGSYIGSHVRMPREGILDRVALVIGLIGAIVGPFVLLAIGGRDPSRPDQPNLPWYFLAIVLVLVLVIVGVGFVLFTRESHYEDEISISPDTRREHPGQS
jgi:MFS family permease